MIALIDNYDSFTFNVYHCLSHYDEVAVVRNTDSLNALTGLPLRGLVISPGPSHPAHSLLTLEAIRHYAGSLPILGICLGMQAIAYAFGHQIRRARRVMHGKVDTIENRGGVLFDGLEEKFPATRYHSLVVDVRNQFQITAVSQTDGETMAIEDPILNLYGLQFHPESHATRNGMVLIRNFLEVCNGMS